MIFYGYYGHLETTISLRPINFSYVVHYKCTSMLLSNYKFDRTITMQWNLFPVGERNVP